MPRAFLLSFLSSLHPAPFIRSKPALWLYPQLSIAAWASWALPADKDLPIVAALSLAGIAHPIRRKVFNFTFDANPSALQL